MGRIKKPEASTPLLKTTRIQDTSLGRHRSSAIVVIGIGNALCGDDAVGLVVARKLKEKARAEVRIVEARGETTALIEVWKDADTVILIDAVRSGARPGTIHRLDVHAEPIPASVAPHSTHALGVVEAIELARTLHQLPSRLTLYGIEGQNFEAGAGLSPEVEKAVREVTERVVQEVLDHLQNL